MCVVIKSQLFLNIQIKLFIEIDCVYNTFLLQSYYCIH
jgi:hypothetical protein